MSRKPAVLMVLLGLLASSSPVYADQFSDANLRRAQMNTRLLNQNARKEADGMAGKIEAARVTAPRGDGRRSRVEHGGLTNQANALNHQMMR